MNFYGFHNPKAENSLIEIDWKQSLLHNAFLHVCFWACVC